MAYNTTAVIVVSTRKMFCSWTSLRFSSFVVLGPLDETRPLIISSKLFSASKLLSVILILLPERTLHTGTDWQRTWLLFRRGWVHAHEATKQCYFWQNSVNETCWPLWNVSDGQWVITDKHRLCDIFSF